MYHFILTMAVASSVVALLLLAILVGMTIGYSLRVNEEKDPE